MPQKRLEGRSQRSESFLCSMFYYDLSFCFEEKAAPADKGKTARVHVFYFDLRLPLSLNSNTNAFKAFLSCKRARFLSTRRDSARMSSIRSLRHSYFGFLASLGIIQRAAHCTAPLHITKHLSHTFTTITPMEHISCSRIFIIKSTGRSIDKSGLKWPTPSAGFCYPRLNIAYHITHSKPAVAGVRALGVI